MNSAAQSQETVTETASVCGAGGKNHTHAHTYPP